VQWNGGRRTQTDKQDAFTYSWATFVPRGSKGGAADAKKKEKNKKKKVARDSNP